MMTRTISTLLSFIADAVRRARKRRPAANPFSVDPLSHFYEVLFRMGNNMSEADWPEVDVRRYGPRPPLKDRS